MNNLSGLGNAFVANGTQYLDRYDQLGSSLATVSQISALQSAREYDAYGREFEYKTGPRSVYRFAGKHGYVSDWDTKMLLLGARYYIPQLGRFLTQDPIGQAGGLNLYNYCDNNPLAKVDPDGKDPGDLFKSPDGAAKDAARYTGVRTVEAGGWVYGVGKDAYSYTFGVSDNGAFINIGQISRGPRDSKVIGSWHSHPPTPDYKSQSIFIGGNTSFDTFSGLSADGRSIQWDTGLPNDLVGNHNRFNAGFGQLHWLVGGNGVVYRYTVPVGSHGKAANRLGPIVAIGRWR